MNGAEPQAPGGQGDDSGPLRIVCAAADEARLQALLGAFERIAEPASGFFLSFADDVLELRRADDRRGVWVRSEEIDRRLAGQFMLGRACGVRRELRILDATGGMGVDALALARRGASVQIVEREPVLWALLKDLIRREGETAVHATMMPGIVLMR